MAEGSGIFAWGLVDGVGGCGWCFCICLYIFVGFCRYFCRFLNKVRIYKSSKHLRRYLTLLNPQEAFGCQPKFWFRGLLVDGLKLVSGERGL